ncbi:MAG: glycosyltransferase [Nanoarchaeota archaeon]
MKKQKFITVIIATYNRCESLKDTLDSLFKQECKGDFDYEIIVVDNNSKDKTKELTESYFQKFNGKLKYLFEPNQGKSIALNKAIEVANGGILAFSDDDCILDKSWLTSIFEFFEKNQGDAMGGRVLPLYPDKTPQWVKNNRELLKSPFVSHDYGEGTKIYENKEMVPFVGANMAIKSVVFDEHGLFKTDLGPGTGLMGDDTELFRRFEKNKELYYCGKALVWHKVDKGRMNYGYMAKYFFTLGRYSLRKQYTKLETKELSCFFYIPRCFLRNIIWSACVLVVSLFSINKFLKRWIILFWEIGECYEYRVLKISEVKNKFPKRIIDDGE